MKHTAPYLFPFVLWLVLARAAPACAIPESPGPEVKSPAALMDLGHFRQAEATLEPLLDSRPEDPNLQWLLSRAKTGLGELEPALKLAEKALRSDENNAAYHVQVAAVTGRLAEKAGLLKQLGLARRAKKELDLALTLDPRNLDALYGLMLYYDAAPSFIGGDKQKARQMADAMTAINPGRGYLAQSFLAKSQKDSAKEEAYYLKSIEADPQFFEAKATLSGFYLAQGKTKYAAAEKYACEALAIDPAGTQAWKNLAEIRAAEQCWTELDALLTEAEERNPFDLAGYYVAATTLLRTGRRLDSAETYLRTYLAKPPDANEPSPGYAHWQLATVLDKLGRKAEAIAELEQALKDEPGLEGPRKDLERLRARER